MSGVIAITLLIETPVILFPSPGSKTSPINSLGRAALITSSGRDSSQGRLMRASGTPVIGSLEMEGGAIAHSPPINQSR